MCDLRIQKLQCVSQTEKRRKHYRYIVREQIKRLPEDIFTLLAIECLHNNHYPILEEYMRCAREWRELPSKRGSDKRCKDLRYLLTSHRKTITVLLTDLTPDGYTPELAEWFLLYGEGNGNRV
jgi:hypothetical protein